jgi:hypothetical protein
MSTATLIQPTTEAPETATDSDGWIFRLDDGEVIGRLDADGYLVREAFTVDSEASADWVLSVRAETEARVVALDAQFSAYRRNYEARRNALNRRLGWWEFRFAPSLIAWARSQLTGKSRTWQGQWGRVAFRKTQGTNEIIDMEGAVHWMIDRAPDKVKTVRSVGVKDVLETLEDGDRPAFLVSAPGRESVSVSTGVEGGQSKQR